ncbi:zinc finger BED domain-containing protein RICESLEEPER 2-like [Cannabis sativa]|uniref:zinc finger BED domain-containing protein RICESLEEPER 2-like n=1 Tax=Cannabis sativa TaxID=3483 RepID=UPI0029CAAAA8|nr:zinc finger BED domain-containing protein RICESLEEPER 2-like [Cannabis sativa]
MVLNGKMLHMRCVCHIINLIVGDGLKDVHTSISSIRNVVRYVRSSPARLQKFKEYVADENIESKSLLCLDVQTRWNSTYLMLEAALKFQKAFERLEDDESYSNYFSDGFNEKRIDGPPSDDDWANAKVFVRFLNTFYTLTLKFSGSLYSTSNLYLDRISDVHRQLKSLVNCQDPILSKMAGNMHNKFNKYWGKSERMNHVLILGMVLDPRYKLAYSRHCLSFIFDENDVDALIKSVEETLRGMFAEYGERFTPSTNGSGSQTPSQTSSNVLELSSLNDEDIGVKQLWILQQQAKQCGGTEVDTYFVEQTEDPTSHDFDILGWWKGKTKKYPILSEIARDVLASPVSTVASESAFSTSGRILDNFRSSLTPKMVEACICSKNWFISSREPVVVRQYMDEVQTFQDSIEGVPGNVEL